MASKECVVGNDAREKWFDDLKKKKKKTTLTNKPLESYPKKFIIGCVIFHLQVSYMNKIIVTKAS